MLISTDLIWSAAILPARQQTVPGELLETGTIVAFRIGVRLLDGFQCEHLASIVAVAVIGLPKEKVVSTYT